METTMELGDDASASCDFDVDRMYLNAPKRHLPHVIEWREMPLTKGLPAKIGVSIRVTHRRQMAFRWRFRELRIVDYEAKRLPKDWHEWMECAGGEYGVYDCTCDAWDTPPQKRATQIRRNPDLQLIVDTPSQAIQQDRNESVILPAECRYVDDSHPDDGHNLRVSLRIGNRVILRTSASKQRSIEVLGHGLESHAIMAGQDRTPRRSDERSGRRAQHRLRVEVVGSGIRGGMYSLW